MSEDAKVDQPAPRLPVPSTALSALENHGSWVLLVAAIVAWVLAVVLDAHQALSTTFVLVGFAALCGSVFFHRVRKIGREGVELAESTLELVREAPVDPDDSPEESRNRAVEYAREHLPVLEPVSADTAPATRAAWMSARQRSMEQDRVSANMVAAVGNFLGERGFTLGSVSQDDIRADLEATRGEKRILLDIRPTVTLFRAADAPRVAAATEVDSNVRRILVLRAGEWSGVTGLASERLEREGIQVWFADPDTLEVITPETES